MSEFAEEPWDRRSRQIGPLVIAACGLLAYCNTFHVPFVFDGDNYLEKNEVIRSLRDPVAIVKHVPARAVVYFSFALNYQIGQTIWNNGYHLPSWHLTNLAIHVAAAYALYGVARRALRSPRLVETFGPSSARVALAIAVIWVVHPLATQSVTYLYQRLESLMGMFYLATFYCFVRYCETSRIAWAATSVVCCALAMDSKEAAVTLPVMLVWYDRVFVSDTLRELIKQRGYLHLLHFACIAVPLVLIFANAQAYRDAGLLDTGRVTVPEYARTQPEVVLHYLRLVFVPWPLNIDYAWKPVKEWKDFNLAAALACGGLIAATAWATFKKPVVGFLGGWWFVTLAPTSSIAPIIDIAFEHRTYLATIGPIALVVGAAYSIIGRTARRFEAAPTAAGDILALLVVLVVAAFTSLTLLRNHDYRSKLAIWRDVVEKSPNSPRSHYNYGVYLQTADPPLIDEAIAEYHRTIELGKLTGMPYLDPDCHLNLGNLAAYRQEWETAKEHYEKLRDLQQYENAPHLKTALYGLAQAMEKLGDPDGARYAVEQLLQLDPHHAEGKALQARLLDSAAARESR